MGIDAFPPRVWEQTGEYTDDDQPMYASRPTTKED